MLETMEAVNAAFADANTQRSQRASGRSAVEEPLLGGILRIAKERFGAIALVTLCVVAGTAALVYELPEKYSASAEVIFDPRKSNGVESSSDSADVSSDPSTVQNQIRILTSRNLAVRVIERLGLAADPELNTGESAIVQNAAPPSIRIAADAPAEATAMQAPPDQVVDAFLKNLSAQPLGLSTTISITFTSRDPLVASAVANAIADAYIENQIDIKSQAARVAATWLSQRVQHLAVDTQRAEAQVQDYKRANGISEVANAFGGGTESTPLVDQELVALQTQLVQARANLAEKKAIRDSLQALIASGSAADLSQVSVSPLIVQLRQQEADLIQSEADLKARYGPKHPKLIAAEAQEKSIENKIALEVDRIARAVDSDVVVAQAQVKSLEMSLDNTQRQASSENMARAQLQSLEANAKSTRTAYETFVSRLRDVQGQEAMQVADANIISRAAVPDSANPPSRILLISASIPVGFLLGLLLVLLQERAQGGLSRSPGIPRLSAPILTRVPDLARQGWPGAGIAGLIVAAPLSQYAQSIAELERRIAENLGGRSRVIGIVSPTSPDGAAIVALSLARAAARNARRVLLIDGGPECNVARASGGGATPPGLPYVLSGRSSLAQSLVRDAASGAFFLSGPWGHVAPERVLASIEMQNFLGHLRGSFDLVILAAAAPAALAPLAHLTDGAMVLLGWNGTPLPSIAQTNAWASRFSNAGLVLAD
ncbi:MAG: exopolysaccharide transport family protein [Rhizomicrobium sp.]|jgi:uncharacterized protein involved in exopolysaccharide biosynthesis/Mrp family chromosome partitioning ATPase